MLARLLIASVDSSSTSHPSVALIAAAATIVAAVIGALIAATASGRSEGRRQRINAASEHTAASHKRAEDRQQLAHQILRHIRAADLARTDLAAGALSSDRRQAAANDLRIALDLARVDLGHDDEVVTILEALEASFADLQNADAGELEDHLETYDITHGRLMRALSPPHPVPA